MAYASADTASNSETQDLKPLENRCIVPELHAEKPISAPQYEQSRIMSHISHTSVRTSFFVRVFELDNLPLNFCHCFRWNNRVLPHKRNMIEPLFGKMGKKIDYFFNLNPFKSL